MKDRPMQLYNFLKDKKKKKYSTIFKEIKILKDSIGYFPTHYFTRFLYQNDIDNYLDYIDNRTVIKIMESNKLHTKESIYNLSNKVRFSKICSENNIPTVKMIGSNDKEMFFYNNEKIEINSYDFFKLLLNRIYNDQEIESIFIKPIDGQGGRGCNKINKSTYMDDTSLEKIYLELSIGQNIMQEEIKQHKKLDNLNSSSINTMRIDTYFKNEKVYILSGVLRVGREGSLTDNITQGGIFIPLNIKNGKLLKKGRQFLKVSSEWFFEHPDSKIEFHNYEIPYFQEVIDIINNVVPVFEDSLVGWDIAITDKGPIVLEGNHNYHIPMQEIAYGGYRVHPIFKEILKNMEI